MGSGNWIVDNLNSALATWNEKLTEIWTLISTSPEEFKGAECLITNLGRKEFEGKIVLNPYEAFVLYYKH